MGKGTLKQIIDSGELAGDDLEAALNALRSRKADGGIARLGFKFGGSAKFLKKISNKMIKKAADDIFPTDDYKYDAELVVDALVENNPKIFKNMLAGDLDDALRSELYGLAVSETGN
jgi:ribosomal protein S17E